MAHNFYFKDRNKITYYAAYCHPKLTVSKSVKVSNEETELLELSEKDGWNYFYYHCHFRDILQDVSFIDGRILLDVDYPSLAENIPDDTGELIRRIGQCPLLLHERSIRDNFIDIVEIAWWGRKQDSKKAVKLLKNLIPLRAGGKKLIPPTIDMKNIFLIVKALAAYLSGQCKDVVDVTYRGSSSNWDEIKKQLQQRIKDSRVKQLFRIVNGKDNYLKNLVLRPSNFSYLILRNAFRVSPRTIKGLFKQSAK